MMSIIEGSGRATGFRFAIVVSKFHDFVTDRLQAGALAALEAAGVGASDITVVRVPGAFEIPIAAQHAAESGHFDAIVCLGCVIRGETPHFEYIASAVANGLSAPAMDRRTKVGKRRSRRSTWLASWPSSCSATARRRRTANECSRRMTCRD